MACIMNVTKALEANQAEPCDIGNVTKPPEETDQKRTKEELHCPADHVTELHLSVYHAGVYTVFGSG